MTGAPPAFLIPPADDAGVPVENGLRFATALRKRQGPGRDHVYEHGPHGFGLGVKIDPGHLASVWMVKDAGFMK